MYKIMYNDGTALSENVEDLYDADMRFASEDVAVDVAINLHDSKCSALESFKNNVFVVDCSTNEIVFDMNIFLDCSYCD